MKGKNCMLQLDLHIHTTASDGQYTPAEIINLAKAAKLAMVSVTDHDTLEGLPEAKRQASSLGIKFIPGVEISTQDTEEIHILGYGMNEMCPELEKRCVEYTRNRLKRGERICHFLIHKGIEVSLHEVKQLAGNGTLGRPHFAAWLLEHGYVSSRREAFQRYLDTPEFHKNTERVKPTPENAIGLIHRAGGMAVLAHPGLLKMTIDKQAQLISTLKIAGLDGIECFYSKHDTNQTERYLSFAEKFDLKISCGSDFHGEEIKPDVPLGMNFDMETYKEKWIFKGGWI